MMTFAAYRLPDPTRPCTLQYTLLLLLVGCTGRKPGDEEARDFNNPEPGPSPQHAAYHWC